MKALFEFISLILIIHSRASTLKINVDTEDFKHLVLNNDVFVDKTLLIDQLLTRSEVTLILRPNGWGKSTNMDMIRRFFEIEVDDLGNPLPKEQTTNDKLFFGGVINTSSNQTRTLKPLKIAHTSNTHHQGKYPVILVKFKNITGNTYEKVIESIQSSIKETYEAHKYLLKSSRITKSDQLERYFTEGFDDKSLRSSLCFLSEKLHEHFGESVVILIDDYEIPLINAFTIYHQLVKPSRPFHFHVENFLLEMYNAAFRPLRNQWVKQGLLVGEHLIPVDDREGLFSGISMFRLYYEDGFSQFYGITGSEIKELSSNVTDLDENALEIKTWYNGYKYSNQSYYNSRSMMRYLAEKGTFTSYVTEIHNTDHGARYIDQILTSDEMQKRIQTLLSEDCDFSYRTTRKYINMEYKSKLCSKEDQTRLLINKGYLALDREEPNNILWCLYIPNNEMRFLFQVKIMQWVCAKFDITGNEFRCFASLLAVGTIGQFTNFLLKYHDKVVKYLETGEDNLFVLYNGLMTALQVTLSSGHYVIRSTDDWQEWRYGKGHDMHMIPKHILSGVAIFLKCKIVEKEYLQSTVDDGLKQINIHQFEDKWKDQYQSKIRYMIKLSIAVSGEEIAVKYDTQKIQLEEQIVGVCNSTKKH